MTTLRTLGRALPAIVVVICLVGLALLSDRIIESTARPVGRSDPLLRVAVLASGMALLGSGAFALAVGTLARVGTIAVLTGLAWFGPEVAKFATGEPVLRSAAVAAGLLVLPLLTHLVLAMRSAGATGRSMRGTVVLVDIAVAAAAVAVLLTYAPFYDPHCPEACNFLTAIVVSPGSISVMVGDAARLVTVAAGGVLVLAAAIGIMDRRARSSARDVLAAGAIAVGLGGAGYALVSLKMEKPHVAFTLDDAAWLALAMLCLGLATIAAGLALAVGSHLRARFRISSLAQSLSTATRLGSIEHELSRALDDAQLSVGYLVDPAGALVDADGEPVDLALGPGRDTTTLGRAGVVLATVAHRDDLDRRVLLDAFRPSLLVSLDNERLRALRLARLRELRESRARIVELADAERRRVERDLHDGAQQGLLAVAFDLRLASVTAEREGRIEAALLHRRAEASALAIVEDLRRLCRGIHPQVLSQAGLGPALASLAEDTEIPLEVSMGTTDRAPAAVETAAYELIRDALTQAQSRGAPALDVSVERVADALVVEASDGAADALRVRQRSADRVGAVGGSLVAGVRDGRGFVHAELPCG